MSFECILDAAGCYTGLPRRLHDSRIARALEAQAATELPPHTLMQRAGLAVARLALALAPHARTVWLACGPGNNGGDGFAAALHLQRWGQTPIVTWLGQREHLTPDAAVTYAAAHAAGVAFATEPPAQFDLAIDALFGIGSLRAFEPRCIAWIERLNAQTAPVLAVDVPSGLNADTGLAGAVQVRADATLSLLTLKPGLFTADGRAVCGSIWFDALGVAEADGHCAELGGVPAPVLRPHNSHKGSYGDVAVVGGQPGMAGAAVLAARAALQAGAGRVFLGLLGADAPPLDWGQPELMGRAIASLELDRMTVVAGCGGGTAIPPHLAQVLAQSQRLVLDADALNAIATDTAWQQQVAARSPRVTVLTPHPLEAARLLGLTTAQVQANRLQAATTLAERYRAIVVLKGSGTVIAAPGQTPRINPSGNARLATPGSGDVLAGAIGARLAAGAEAFDATCAAVFWHGQAATLWPEPGPALTASALAASMPC